MKKILITILLIPFITFAQSKKELKIIQKAASEITMEKDKYDGTTTWRSPFFGKGLAATTKKRVSFTRKLDKDGNISYYLSLTAYGLTLNTNKEGFILLFEDGSRLEKPKAEVDVKAETGSYWEYSVFVRLTKEELDMFANKKVDSFRIYIYEGKPINKKSILQTMGYARAINI